MSAQGFLYGWHNALDFFLNPMSWMGGLGYRNPHFFTLINKYTNNYLLQETLLHITITKDDIKSKLLSLTK